MQRATCGPQAPQGRGPPRASRGGAVQEGRNRARARALLATGPALGPGPDLVLAPSPGSWKLPPGDNGKAAGASAGGLNASPEARRAAKKEGGYINLPPTPFSRLYGLLRARLSRRFLRARYARILQASVQYLRRKGAAGGSGAPHQAHRRGSPIRILVAISSVPSCFFLVLLARSLAFAADLLQAGEQYRRRRRPGIAPPHQVQVLGFRLGLPPGEPPGHPPASVGTLRSAESPLGVPGGPRPVPPGGYPSDPAGHPRP